MPVLRQGTKLKHGTFEVVSYLARGGFGEVYLARQPRMQRDVAIKVLLHNHDPQFASRFKREARAIAQLQHPNILPIYEYGEQDGLVYLVLQYIENGVTLADMLGKPLAPVAAMTIFISGLQNHNFICTLQW